MSDWYETVVDPVVTPQDAHAVAETIVSGLIAAGLIKAERTDCTLGETGFPPAVGVLDYLRSPDDLLMSLRTNGMAVLTGRSVHLSTTSQQLICPLCGTRVEDVHQLPWQEAVGDWYDGGSGLLRCPTCLRDTTVTQWTHEPAGGFGNLAFTFWNWPPFTAEYWRRSPAELIESTVGHKCVLVSGKL